MWMYTMITRGREKKKRESGRPQSAGSMFLSAKVCMGLVAAAGTVPESSGAPLRGGVAGIRQSMNGENETSFPTGLDWAIFLNSKGESATWNFSLIGSHTSKEILRRCGNIPNFIFPLKKQFFWIFPITHTPTLGNVEPRYYNRASTNI